MPNLKFEKRSHRRGSYSAQCVEPTVRYAAELGYQVKMDIPSRRNLSS
jgi:hypothetical protein